MNEWTRYPLKGAEAVAVWWNSVDNMLLEGKKHELNPLKYAFH